jgi:hypothetical protein
LGKARFDYLKSLGIQFENDELNNLLNNFNPETETFDQTQLDLLVEGIKETKVAFSDLDYQILSNATSLEQLDGLYSQLDDGSQQAYSEALVGLAANYEGTSEAITKYN